MSYLTTPEFMKKATSAPPLLKGEDKNAEKHRLILGCQRFVVKMAKKFAKNEDELPDYIQQGNIALCIAANKFKPEKGAFITIAAFEIRNQMQVYQRKYTFPFTQNLESYKNRSPAMALHEKGLSDDQICSTLNLTKSQIEMALYLNGCCIDGQDIEKSYDNKQPIFDEINRLNKHCEMDATRRNVLYLRLSGHNTGEITKILSISQARVFQIENEYTMRRGATHITHKRGNTHENHETIP